MITGRKRKQKKANMILPIYTYGQPVLRKEAEPLDTASAEVRQKLEQLIPDMFETLAHADGVGLAAPQIGLDIRMVIVDLSPCAEEDPAFADYKKVYINPDIYEESEEECSMGEGCLSLPGIHESVKRPVSVKVRYLDEHFQEHDEELTGFPARVILHECDHLDGTMFIDHLSSLRKQMIRGKLTSLLKGKVHADYKTKSVRKP